MKPFWVVLLLTLLLGIQPVTTDLYLPALPSLTRALETSVPAVQLTLSALILAFGIAQLVCGPLADRFGRRPVLLAGLALYTVASVGSATADVIETLIAWRTLQGAAMAAAITCGRAVVRDLYEPHEGARMLSRALSGLGVIAMITPFVGGVLAHAVSWRATFGAVASFGAVTLGLVLWRFVETVPARNPRALQLQPLAANWRVILGHPTFRAWSALLMSTYGGLFLMLAASSFVYIDVLGLTQLQYSAFLATNSVAYLSGTFLCRRLLAQHGLARTAAVGGALSASGGLLMVALAWAGWVSPWAIAGPQLLYALGHGVNQPCGQAGAIGPFPDKAGTAASLSGFLMMVVAFGVGLWIGRSLDGTVMPLASGMAFFGSLVGIVTWTLVRWHGEPDRPLATHVP
jgi:MFS transporter, DHA1 family, multidrug resistance protein